ncbi:MAG: Heparinase family protein [Burkholderia sp.]|nr:Heparinase family protein [Burkholderia sp.]
MPSLTWKFNRLRSMSAAEILWRGRRAAQAAIDRRRNATHPPHARDVSGRGWVQTGNAGVAAAPYLHAADRILLGRFDLFALCDVELGFPPQWSRDPKTGVVAPLRFGHTLDYRDEKLVGDIKYLWQLNRHYELVTLAQAFRLSGKAHYAQACMRLLESWFEKAPHPLGPNWTSSLEHALRLVNWSVAWDLLGGRRSLLFEDEAGKEFMRRWLDAIYLHCDFIANHLSLFSSANNHLLGEYMGLFIGATTWPCWQRSERWRSIARRGLEEEALRQNGADGVNLEQATWYHHEVADMMLLCALCGRRNDIAFSDAYWKRLEAMLAFIAAVMNVSGKVPMIGDSDDAMMVRFSQEPDFDVYRSLLATGAVLFRRRDFRHKAHHFDDKSRWLLGDIGADVFEALPASEPGSLARNFPHGGYYILGSDFDTASEVRIVADAGPLGYLSLAAHGHADALAFCLSAGGEELLIDPGTYAYHTQQKWRDYFRGTSAHNTVKIDGSDQSEMGGNFMWLRKADAVCETWLSDAAKDFLVGRHNGYARLPDPVMHTRKIEYLKRERVLLVEDTLRCRAAHDVEFWWHFAERCDVHMMDKRILARSGRVRLEMCMPDGECEPELLVGTEQPPAGWISRRFDEKTPSPSLRWKSKINGTATHVTAIRIGFVY